MISDLLEIYAKGRNVISRYYRYIADKQREETEIVLLRARELIWLFSRGDVSRETADAFRQNVIAKKDTGTLPPIHYIDGASFIYVRNADHYIVAVTKKNANPGMESYRPWLCRHDLPLPLPLGQDVQELLRQRVPGCMLPPSMLMCRMIFVTSSPLSMKFSMV